MTTALRFAIASAVLVFASATEAEEIPADAVKLQLHDSSKQVATWSNEAGHHFAISGPDGSWRIVNDTSYDIQLRYAAFDPLKNTPQVPDLLRVNLEIDTAPTGVVPQRQVYIVQFKTQAIEEYRQAIRNVGGEIHKFLPHHAYLVELSDVQRQAVLAMPIVRWVGLYQPAYKLDSELLAALLEPGDSAEPVRVNIMVHRRGTDQKKLVAELIRNLGGTINALTPDGFRLEATLNDAQLTAVAKIPEVFWIDRWSEREPDMDLAREIGGANFIETVDGFTGQGVRGEVMDNNLFDSHVAFQSNPPIFHGPRGGFDDHGTGTFGIVFGDGTGNMSGRGMLPDAQGIFADYGELSNRYTHTAQLVQAPFFAVFQSNSWGNSQTTSYSSISAELDDIIFINDILLTQSQSNTDSTFSRPQAWAKNVVSVGGVNHGETLGRSDDFWNGASIGPAADGRIKPDLVHFYDSIWTTDDTSSGYRNFCCTSGATPIVGGHFGLLFQMWSEGIFGNEVDDSATVFENRPHSTTARALMINQANSYPFSGTADNLTRVHQGWGMPDLMRIYDAKDSMFIVNEEVVLQNLESASFELPISGSGDLRATLVYLDPMGTTSASLHRINDLSLKVTSPDGTEYWGNNGLQTGNWSTPGGSANSIDPVENVFIQNPTPGLWNVEVIAVEINEDAHVETPAVDADFALVVSGITPIMATLDELTIVQGLQSLGDLKDIGQSDDSYVEFLADANALPDGDPLVVEFGGTLSDSEPGSIAFTLENQVNSSGLALSIEIFNFETDSFEAFESEDASNGSDESITVNVAKDASDYVEPKSGKVRARVSWSANGPTLMFPWRASVDFAAFSAN